jgi:hypothetical protein
MTYTKKKAFEKHMQGVFTHYMDYKFFLTNGEDEYWEFDRFDTTEDCFAYTALEYLQENKIEYIGKFQKYYGDDYGDGEPYDF